ncbi:MAG: TM2 domain-containing protein [Bacteroidota bacterium]|jgi:TM2 domain-containing membrane protein YozV
MKSIALLIAFFICSYSHAQTADYSEQLNKFNHRKSIQYLKTFKNQKAVAIALNATMGYFGVHRMYLGTDVKIPVLYSVTVGGGGVLWLVDLGILIGVKDIKQFYNNPHFFMWNTNPTK